LGKLQRFGQLSDRSRGFGEGVKKQDPLGVRQASTQTGMESMDLLFKSRWHSEPFPFRLYTYLHTRIGIMPNNKPLSAETLVRIVTIGL
jgi:hypothetical protein